MSLDFIDSVLNKINDERKPLWNFDVSSLLYSAAQRETLSDEERAIFLAEVAVWEFHGLRDRKSRWGTFFGPQWELKQEDGTESVQPDITKMNDSVLPRWKARSTKLDHPVLVAQYADVLWDISRVIVPSARRDFRSGQIAIDAYQQSVREGLSQMPSFDLQRALDIATELNDPARINSVCDQILTVSEGAPIDNIGSWKAAADAFEGKDRIAEVHRKRMIDGLEARLSNTAKLLDGYATRIAGGALLKVYKRTARLEDRKRVLRTVADTYLRQSRTASPGVAVAWLHDVISLLEKEGLRDDAEPLRLEMEKRGPEALAAMKTLTAEVSFPKEEIDAELEKLLSVNHPVLALLRLTRALIPNCDLLRKRVKDAEKQFAFYSLIPRSIIGRDGIPIATIGSSEHDMEGRMMEDIHFDLQTNSGLFMLGLQRFREKFGLTVEPIIELAKPSSLVTGDMHKPLEGALTAYESGDYSKTISILIPQLEAMLRELLKLLGISTRKGIRKAPGGSDLKNMNDVLSDQRVIDNLEENLVFFLRAVYIDKRALNLRNDFAHGDIPHEGFNEMTGSLVVMSVIVLAAIGPHTMYLESESAVEDTAGIEVPHSSQKRA